jgi:hypothetical protein
MFSEKKSINQAIESGREEQHPLLTHAVAICALGSWQMACDATGGIAMQVK